MHHLKRRNSKKLDKHFQDLALIISLHCVRNTVLEKYHAAGKLTNADMKALNQEVVNKIYSMLQLLFNSSNKSIRNKLLFSGGKWNPFYLPTNWNKPKFDKSFNYLIKIAKKVS